jgi:hypothetical protein
MNSIGSVSRVSESIYKFLRYMNWVDANPTTIVTDIGVRENVNGSDADSVHSVHIDETLDSFQG